MKTIPLTQGKAALVDDEDFHWLNQWKWCAHKRTHRSGSVLVSKWYAVRTSYSEGRQVTQSMHRVIADAEGMPQIDHRDGDGLNNQRNNLRPATPAQNHANRQKRLCSTSSYKGVYWNRRLKKWHAQFKANGRNRPTSIGYFTDEIVAARAYDAASLEHYGDFARLNFPQSVTNN